jgi:hypothetical protein
MIAATYFASEVWDVLVGVELVAGEDGRHDGGVKVLFERCRSVTGIFAVVNRGSVDDG